MKLRLAVTLVAVLVLCRCGGSPSSPEPVPVTSQADQNGSGVAERAVLVGAGDIGDCNTPGSSLTAQLLDTIDGIVFTTGDNAYPSGTAERYRDCYETTWGRHRARTRPTPGNHEYDVPTAAPYFQYFGANAGPSGLGYYSYNAGAWHVVSLNSEIDASAGSPQERWLRADLAANRTRCTAAYWHKPLFSSGPHGNTAAMIDIWRTLYEFDAEIVINGHDHEYERFRPQDPNGAADSARGVREFVVGTGGSRVSNMIMVRPNSEMQVSSWGVLMLVLHSNYYRWQFLTSDGATGDAGETACH
jgi:hypothetical protein